MKRDKLQQALRRIKTRTPRWFWTRCQKCRDQYKNEPMFCFWYTTSGLHTLRYMIWNCTTCCPTVADVLIKNQQYFGTIDVSPLREEVSPLQGEIICSLESKP